MLGFVPNRVLEHTGGYLMKICEFLIIGVVIAGMSVPALATESGDDATTLLTIKKTEQQLLAESVQAVLGGDEQKQSLARFISEGGSNKDGAESQISGPRITYSRLFNSAERRWNDQGSLGLSLQSGPTSIGLWGDVREVNIVEDGNQYLLPTSLNTNSVVPVAAGGTQPANSLTGEADLAPRNSISVNSPGNVSNNVRAISPNGGGFSGRAGGSSTGRVASQVSSINNSTDLAYKEYIGGLFMSQSF